MSIDISISIYISMSMSIYRPTYLYKGGEHACDLIVFFNVVSQTFRLFTGAFFVLSFFIILVVVTAAAVFSGKDGCLRCLYRRYPSQAIPQKQA